MFFRIRRQAEDRGITMIFVSRQMVYVSNEIDCLILLRRAVKDLSMVCDGFTATVCQVDTDNKPPQSSKRPSESSPTHPTPAPPSPTIIICRWEGI